MTAKPLLLLALVTLGACKLETTTTTTTSSSTQQATPSAAVATETTATAATATSPTDAVGTGACALVTLGEVSEVMAHAMKFKEATNPAECVLVSASDDATKSVSFQVHDGTQPYDAMQSGQKQEPIPDLGEKAVIGATTNMVLVVKGGRTYIGAVYDAAAPTTAKEKSIELARKAVARM